MYYNLKAYALTDKIAADTGKVGEKKIINIPGKAETYAYVANYSGFDELKFVAALYNKKIKLRYSLKPFYSKRQQVLTGEVLLLHAVTINNLKVILTRLLQKQLINARLN